MNWNLRKTNWRISFFFYLIVGSTYSQSFSEGFENFANLSNWYFQNNSNLPNAEWGIGDTTIFSAQAGTTGSYLSVNYQSSSSSTGTTLSNWLFTPTRTFNNGDVITFYTRTENGSLFPDRMEVRFSASGNGLDCGTNPLDVGTFTTLLLTINPTLTTSGYPEVWTQYTINISGLSGPTNGRIAFRYFVTNGGPGGTNSNYIGLDSYTYSSVSQPPNNDQCSGAVSLSQETNCNPVSGTVAHATESQVGCAGTSNDDVWYSFVANSTGASITLNGTPSFDAVYEVFSGNCSNLTSLSCVNSGAEGETESGVLNNLILGQTYYIRVYDWLNDIPNTMNFDICVEEFTQCELQQPSGSVLESESCGADLNGGCYSSPLAYQQIMCGDTIFGNTWADNGSRDLDWFSFQIYEPGNVIWSATAEFPYFLHIVDISNCASPIVLASANFNSCESGMVSFNLGVPGNYAVVIGPSTFYGYPCSSSNISYIGGIDLPAIPAQLSSQVASFCPSDSVIISASSNAIYNWYLNGNQIGVGTTWQATQAGTYSATYIDPNTCLSVSNSLILNNLPLDDASFSYISNTVCANSSNIFALSLLPGIYSSDLPGLVFADTISGEIDMSQSIEGTYQITFSTDSICPNSSTQNFEITSTPNASFSYNDSIVCSNGPNLQVILDTAAILGTFSSNSSSLSISSISGEIDLTQSTGGIYVIYNTIPSSDFCLEVVDSFNIIVNESPQVTFDPLPNMCDTSLVLVLTGVNPAGGSFSGNGIVDSTFDPVIAGVGTHLITYTFTVNGCSSSASQTIVVDNCSDLNELDLNWKIYPNPVENYFRIEGLTDIDEIELFSMDGRFIRKCSNDKLINISELACSNYLLKINSNNRIRYLKLMKH